MHVCCIQLMFILYMLFVSYGLVLFVIHSFMHFLAVRSAENKLQKCKSSYYKARVYTSPKYRDPFLIKEAESKKCGKPNYYNIRKAVT